jgi:hypothetical protein
VLVVAAPHRSAATTRGADRCTEYVAQAACCSVAAFKFARHEQDDLTLTAAVTAADWRRRSGGRARATGRTPRCSQ